MAEFELGFARLPNYVERPLFQELRRNMLFPDSFDKWGCFDLLDHAFSTRRYFTPELLVFDSKKWKLHKNVDQWFYVIPAPVQYPLAGDVISSLNIRGTDKYAVPYNSVRAVDMQLSGECIASEDGDLRLLSGLTELNEDFIMRINLPDVSRFSLYRIVFAGIEFIHPERNQRGVYYGSRGVVLGQDNLTGTVQLLPRKIITQSDSDRLV